MGIPGHTNGTESRLALELSTSNSDTWLFFLSLTAVRSVLHPLSGLLGGNRRLLRGRASDRDGHGRACTGLDDDWIVMIQHYQTAAL